MSAAVVILIELFICTLPAASKRLNKAPAMQAWRGPNLYPEWFMCQRLWYDRDAVAVQHP